MVGEIFYADHVAFLLPMYNEINHWLGGMCETRASPAATLKAPKYRQIDGLGDVVRVVPFKGHLTHQTVILKT
jgi:hypothetical protein